MRVATFGFLLTESCRMDMESTHQKLNGTESQRTPDQVSCDSSLLDNYWGLGVRETWILLEISWKVLNQVIHQSMNSRNFRQAQWTCRWVHVSLCRCSFRVFAFQNDVLRPSLSIYVLQFLQLYKAYKGQSVTAGFMLVSSHTSTHADACDAGRAKKEIEEKVIKRTLEDWCFSWVKELLWRFVFQKGQGLVD